MASDTDEAKIEANARLLIAKNLLAAIEKSDLSEQDKARIAAEEGYRESIRQELQKPPTRATK